MIYFGQYGGSIIQKGYGLGSAFSSFFSWAINMRSWVNAVKQAGKQALSSAGEIIKDVIAGKNVYEAAKEQASVAVDSLKNQQRKHWKYVV